MSHMVSSDALDWAVVAPVKRLDRAKTRLSTRPAAQRRDLALAFAIDSVRAIAASPNVVEVLVVSDDETVRVAVGELGATYLQEGPDAGLNGAVEAGVRHLRARWPDAGVAVVAADLPALRSDELTRALRAAAAVQRGFVADAAGTGSTMLTVLPGVALDPRFGPRSRAAHAASGAVPLEPGPVPGLRRDVDTEVDLWDAGRLGVGSATARVTDLDHGAGR
jgi:2-phospho-L-lactate/phosphoenolpyruvate guanylyltransferase